MSRVREKSEKILRKFQRGLGSSGIKVVRVFLCGKSGALMAIRDGISKKNCQNFGRVQAPLTGFSIRKLPHPAYG
jgi:hypothetical protein